MCSPGDIVVVDGKLPSDVAITMGNSLWWLKDSVAPYAHFGMMLIVAGDRSDVLQACFVISAQRVVWTYFSPLDNVRC